MRFIAQLALCSALGLSLVAAGPAAAQNKTVLKLGWATADSAQDSYAIAAHAFKKALENESKGTMEVQLFPNRQIGDEKQLIEGLRLGTVDAAVVTNGAWSPVEPAFQLNDLPFLYATEAQVFKVLDGDVGRKLAAKMEAKGVVVLGYLASGYRHMLNNKKPVSTPQDVVGVKYRVHNSVAMDMYSALDASPVPMAWGETMTALQQGAVDGMDLPTVLVDALKLYEAVKFMSLTGHTYSVAELGVSKRRFDQLSAAQKDMVRKAAASAVAEQRRVNAANEDKALEILKGKGLKVNAVGDRTAFRRKVQPLYDKLRPSIGADLMDAALAATK
ncbi:TRAP transporter substrate-binding protein [Ramlibacter sp.]|uniref:TRAP transporter substrate-binding protein n=1 Tax=Ramlibacter sp. TaxID=1917967 RepID=UPI003D130A80